MAYLRSVRFHSGLEMFYKRNIGGLERNLTNVTRKTISTAETNKALKGDVLLEQPRPHFGDLKSNSTLTMPQENLHPRAYVDIASLVRDEMKDLFQDIRQELTSRTSNPELQSMVNYYVNGKGKAIRPVMATLMGKSLNYHITGGRREALTSCQRQVAMATEMTHIASIMHDDLLDREELRRGMPSMVSMNHQKVASAGDFVSGTVSSIIARLNNHDVRMILYKMSRDLALGEFLQLNTMTSDNEDMLSRYLKVTHLKAAIVFASSCEAAAVLAGADYFLREAAAQFGRNLGMAFQLADDYKDFETDLAQGVVTSPVLLACKTHRELEGLIRRGFSEAGDLGRTFDLVNEARGLEKTLNWVQSYCDEALRHVASIRESPYQEGLKYICETVLNLVRP